MNMKLFSFDKVWGLNWEKVKGFIFSTNYEKYIVTANKERVSNPIFAIYRHEIHPDTCLIQDLNSDHFIMQLKSIKETGKIVTR